MRAFKGVALHNFTHRDTDGTINTTSRACSVLPLRRILNGELQIDALPWIHIVFRPDPNHYMAVRGLNLHGKVVPKMMYDPKGSDPKGRSILLIPESVRAFLGDHGYDPVIIPPKYPDEKFVDWGDNLALESPPKRQRDESEQPAAMVPTIRGPLLPTASRGVSALDFESEMKLLDIAALSQALSVSKSTSPKFSPAKRIAAAEIVKKQVQHMNILCKPMASALQSLPTEYVADLNEEARCLRNRPHVAFGEMSTEPFVPSEPLASKSACDDVASIPHDWKTLLGLHTVTPIEVGTQFESYEDAEMKIIAFGRSQGHIFVRKDLVQRTNGSTCVLRMVCACAGQRTKRETCTKRIGCLAKVNVDSKFTVSKMDLEHKDPAKTEEEMPKLASIKNAIIEAVGAPRIDGALLKLKRDKMKIRQILTSLQQDFPVLRHLEYNDISNRLKSLHKRLAEEEGCEPHEEVQSGGHEMRVRVKERRQLRNMMPTRVLNRRSPRFNVSL